MILLIAYGVVRGYIFIRDRKLKKLLREDSESIVRKICSVFRKEDTIKKRFFSHKAAKEILRLLKKKAKATIVKKLIFKLEYYVKIGENRPDILKDRKYVREKIIYPIMHEIGVFLSQIDPEIKKIWNSVPKRKRYQEQDKVLPDLFKKICESATSN